MKDSTQRNSPDSPQGQADNNLTAGEGLSVTACSASSFVGDGVESEFTDNTTNTGDVSDLDGYLGEMGYDYCPLLEVVRAAKTKGVGMMKSDLINNQTESLNEGVAMFRGSVGELVDAIYNRFVSGETIQIMLNTLRDRKFRGLHLGDYGSLGSGLH